METIIELVAEFFGVDRGTGYRITLGITVLFTFLFISIMILRVIFGSKRAQSKNSVFLLGTSDSGKTVIFGHLTAGRHVDTYTSMKENIFDGATFCEKGRKYRLVDVPGADRIRKTLLDQFFNKEQPAALIYIVDSSTFQKDCRETAEFLYEILSHPAVSKNRRLPILLACNKQDNPLSKSAQVIRKGLEKEMSLLNKTRAASLESIAGEGDRRLLLGKDNSTEFKFEQLPQNVEFVECVSVGDIRLEPVTDWLKQL